MGLFGVLVGLLLKPVAVLGGLAQLLSKAGAFVWGLVGGLWQKALLVLERTVGTLWTWTLLFVLLVVAVVLNVVGTEDVYARIGRVIDDENPPETDPLDTVRDLSPESVTDEGGRFSPDAFERATGVTPAEFLHLYVRSRGGRVRQKSLTTPLPWSKSKVSRMLDTLEEEGLVRRVSIGRENIVCTPNAVPDHTEK